MHLSDPHHFRKMTAGACMMLAPVLLLAATIVSPELHDGAAAQIAAVADAPDAWYVAQIVGLLAIVLAVPAVLGLMHMLRERRVAEGHLGGGLALMGLLAFTGLTMLGMVVWQMAAPGADAAQMAALHERIDDAAGIVVPFYLGAFLFSAGMCVLAYGLWAGRAVSPITAAFLAAGGVLVALGFALALNWMTIVAAACLCVGLCPIGYLVWSESDAEWEHTPEFRGFRPVAGTS
jgi:hypothetical protein